MNSAAQKVDVEIDGDEYAIHTDKLNLWYGTFQALFDVDLNIRKGMITSLIGLQAVASPPFFVV